MAATRSGMQDWTRFLGGVGIGGGIGGILGGLFGDAGSPYESARDELSKYLPQAQQYQQPFYQAGVGAIPDFQKWLSGMQDPSGFVNKLMGQYQESPYAKYQQQQMQRALQNAGSATGQVGSTGYDRSLAEMTQQISSADMQNWLQNVFGINTQYGQGLGGLMQGGQGAANSLTQMMADYAKAQANLAAAQERAEQEQQGGMFGGVGNIIGGLIGGGFL